LTIASCLDDNRWSVGVAADGCVPPPPLSAPDAGIDAETFVDGEAGVDGNADTGADALSSDV
jgi:hypothetical protein